MGEFDTYFAQYLPGVLEYCKSEGLLESSKTLEDLRILIMDYYDGYSWNGKSRVLSPSSLIKFLSNKEFDAFGFRSTTSTFLLEFIKRVPREYIQLESRIFNESSLDVVDIEKLKLSPLLFQTGCLTIDREIGFGKYLLRGPNLEVDEALNTQLLSYLTGKDNDAVTNLAGKIRLALENFDSTALGQAFSQILSWIPHQLQQSLERYNHAVLYAVLKSLHFRVASEVSGPEGTFDIQITMPKGIVFIGEFKYEKLGSEPEDRTDEKRRILLTQALLQAKKQIEFRKYDKVFLDEHPVVKRLAVGIVGKSDVLAEIY
jgi:hypothetical protein